MKVLIVKTSSMGDVIHTLPALTDAGRAIPGIRFDWIVEENFAEIPRWHPLVDQIFPVALRRWRKNMFAPQTRKELRAVYEQLKKNRYDFIIDAQGLVKSAWLTHLANGVRCGFDWQSAREPLASIFYSRKCATAPVKKQHAIERIRSLFSQALHYPLPSSIPDYGVNRQLFVDETLQQQNYLVFLHGTTWPTKHWPEHYWQQLAVLANQNNFAVKLPWGNEEEQKRAERIASSCQQADVLPRMALKQVATVLASAKAVVAVDTGLGHLTAALAVPAVSLYGPTNAQLTGALGKSQLHLSSHFQCAPCLSRDCTFQNASSYLEQPPCFNEISPAVVWQALATLI